MTISFDIPEDIARPLRECGADLAREAREVYLVELYRQDRITHGQLARALGLDAYETDGVLKRYGVTYDLTAEEFRAQAESLSKTRPG